MTATVSLLVLGGIVAFLLVLAVGLAAELRNIRLYAVRVGQLPIGSDAPDVSVFAYGSDRTVTVPPIDALLLLVSPGCARCHRLLESLARDPDGAETLLGPVVVVCSGGKGPCATLAHAASSSIMLTYDPAGEAADRYGLAQYPMAVYVRRSTIAGYGNPQTLDELMALTRTVVAAQQAGGVRRLEVSA